MQKVSFYEELTPTGYAQFLETITVTSQEVEACHIRRYLQELHVHEITFNEKKKPSANLLYYKLRSLLHVSATYCGHLQGGVPWRVYYTERQMDIQIQNVIILYFNTDFKTFT